MGVAVRAGQPKLMPEGDTLFRTATVLRQALAGRLVTGFRSPLPALAGAALVGRGVTDVEARGKNLLIHFDDGQALYSHLRMSGSWHIYRPGEAWQKPERQARAVLETDAYVAVCFNAPVVELLTERGVARHRTLTRLGPDLLKEDFDEAEALCRLRALSETPIGEALMLQSVLAGIGNVYKSEVLFLCRVDPFTPVSELEESDLKRLIATAREWMARNLEGGPRITRHALDGGHSWVYGRSGRPCRRCGTVIKMRHQGDAGRSTYWCPACQQE